MGNTVRVTRKELYEEVWSMPMSKLAKEYGLSDVGLAKICKRHGIPRPGAGYWLRIAHGQKLRREPLPDAVPGEPDGIEFAIATDANFDEEIRAELARIQQNVAMFSKGQSDKPKHPLVIGPQKIRRELHPETDGRLSANRGSYPDILVTPGSWDRALRIMDMVFNAAERLGYQVRIEPRTGTVIIVLGEDIPIGLKEKMVKSEAPPPDRSDGMYHPLGTTYQYSPTGLLTLSIKNLYLDGGRVNWSDTNRARLEEQIGEFFLGVIGAVVRLRARKAKWDEEARQEKEAARVREQQVGKEQQERDRIQGLNNDADNWHKASMLRSYIAARMKASGGSPSKDLLDWTKWANKYTDSIDPLVGSAGNVGWDNPVNI